RKQQFEAAMAAWKIENYLIQIERDAQRYDQLIYKHLDNEILEELSGGANNFLEKVAHETYDIMLANIEARFSLSISEQDKENVHTRALAVSRALQKEAEKNPNLIPELKQEMDGIMYNTNKQLNHLYSAFSSEVKVAKKEKIKKSIKNFFKPLKNLWTGIKNKV